MKTGFTIKLIIYRMSWNFFIEVKLYSLLYSTSKKLNRDYYTFSKTLITLWIWGWILFWINNICQGPRGGLFDQLNVRYYASLNKYINSAYINWKCKLKLFDIFIITLHRATARTVAPRKRRPSSEVALYYTTRPKLLSPHFGNHTQAPWKVRMERAFQYEKISTTGFRYRLRRV